MTKKNTKKQKDRGDCGEHSTGNHMYKHTQLLRYVVQLLKTALSLTGPGMVCVSTKLKLYRGTILGSRNMDHSILRKSTMHREKKNLKNKAIKMHLDTLINPH